MMEAAVRVVARTVVVVVLAVGTWVWRWWSTGKR